MLEEVLDFWGLSKKEGSNDYSLVLPTMHDIMSLNQDETHQAHTISKYFEINRSKRAVLFLVKKQTERKEIYDEERANLTIKHGVKTKRFDKKDERSPEEIEAENQRNNRERFFKKYPNLKEELIEDMEQFDPNRKDKLSKILKNPDMSFCSFMISAMMFILSLATFYSQREFNNEYFNRQLIFKRLNDNPLGYQNLFNIKSVEDLQFFMNQTVAEQIFEPEQARLLPNQTGFDINYKTTYAFQTGIIPLGKMRIRTQRRRVVPCVGPNKLVYELRDKNQLQCFDFHMDSDGQ
jgi:hypothetical protein